MLLGQAEPRVDLWSRGSYEVTQHHDETVTSVRQSNNAKLVEYVSPAGNCGE